MQALPEYQPMLKELLTYLAPANPRGLAEEPGRLAESHVCAYADRRDCPPCSKMVPRDTPQPSQGEEDRADRAAADLLHEEQQRSSKVQRKREKQKRRKQVRCGAGLPVQSILQQLSVQGCAGKT